MEFNWDGDEASLPDFPEEMMIMDMELPDLEDILFSGRDPSLQETAMAEGPDEGEDKQQQRLQVPGGVVVHLPPRADGDVAEDTARISGDMADSVPRGGSDAQQDGEVLLQLLEDMKSGGGGDCCQNVDVEARTSDIEALVSPSGLVSEELDRYIISAPDDEIKILAETVEPAAEPATMTFASLMDVIQEEHHYTSKTPVDALTSSSFLRDSNIKDFKSLLQGSGLEDEARLTMSRKRRKEKSVVYSRRSKAKKRKAHEELQTEVAKLRAEKAELEAEHSRLIVEASQMGLNLAQLQSSVVLNGVIIPGYVILQ